MSIITGLVDDDSPDQWTTDKILDYMSDHILFHYGPNTAGFREAQAVIDLIRNRCEMWEDDQ